MHCSSPDEVKMADDEQFVEHQLPPTCKPFSALCLISVDFRRVSANKGNDNT